MTAATATTILGSLVGLGGFLFGVYQYRRTVQLSTFRLYADKYNSIVTPELFDKWEQALAGNKDYWGELTPTMIAYLNLTWEELYLIDSGVISKQLWRIWQPVITRNLKTEFAGFVITKYGYHFPPELIDSISAASKSSAHSVGKTPSRAA